MWSKITSNMWPLLVLLIAMHTSIAGNLQIYPPEIHVDIAIIGAGWAGLSAGHTIRQNKSSLTYHILEATDHVGGRTLNSDVVTSKMSTNSSNVVELGGEWLAKSHCAAITLMRDELRFSLYHRRAQYTIREAVKAKRRYAIPPSEGEFIVVNTPGGTRFCQNQSEVFGLLPIESQRQIDASTAAFQSLGQQLPCSGPFNGGNHFHDSFSCLVLTTFAHTHTSH